MQRILSGYPIIYQFDASSLIAMFPVFREEKPSIWIMDIKLEVDCRSKSGRPLILIGAVIKEAIAWLFYDLAGAGMKSFIQTKIIREWIQWETLGKPCYIADFWKLTKVVSKRRLKVACTRGVSPLTQIFCMHGTSYRAADQRISARWCRPSFLCSRKNGATKWGLSLLALPARVFIPFWSR